MWNPCPIHETCVPHQDLPEPLLFSYSKGSLSCRLEELLLTELNFYETEKTWDIAFKSVSLALTQSFAHDEVVKNRLHMTFTLPFRVISPHLGPRSFCVHVSVFQKVWLHQSHTRKSKWFCCFFDKSQKNKSKLLSFFYSCTMKHLGLSWMCIRRVNVVTALWDWGLIFSAMA